jgi:hypothetical protein
MMCLSPNFFAFADDGIPGVWMAASGLLIPVFLFLAVFIMR